MSLDDVWPLFGLRLLTPRIELRPVRDEDLPGLAEAAIAGIHEPNRMPFAKPWSVEPPGALRAGLAKHVWKQRAATEPNEWALLFAVLLDGVPIGVQDLRASDFANRRAVSSGSWLTRSRQGIGLGSEMRAALLAFAFDYLGAETAESSALDWNAASIAVSRKLGYRDNGLPVVSTRPGTREHELRFRVTPNQFVRPDWKLRVEGFEAARAMLLS
ncbi:MAG TPA: GNAT family protein [Candidatus Lumbricidophila sp.]|nr:GNAT family protein [Candidatus Lumbricidophila sp.]